MSQPPGIPRESTSKKLRRRATRRVVLKLAYDGCGFSGFQRQPDRPTIEGTFIEALVALGLTGGLGFASRTDTGVHAIGQVVAFKIPSDTELPVLAADLAARLPAALSISDLTWAPAHFHPRWSATGKRYEYRLALDGAPVSHAWALPGLAIDRFEEALEQLRRAPALDGYTAAGAPPKDAPPLTALDQHLQAGVLTLGIEGPAFRRYAIRHMLGCAVAEARGEIEAGSCTRIAASPPPYRGLRAPADGLTLISVRYPEALDPFAGSSLAQR